MASSTAYSLTHSAPTFDRETDDEADDTFDVELTAVKTLDNTQHRIGVPPSDEILESLKADIEANGVEKPVIVDENGVVIDGHHRVEICRELGISVVPTLTKEGLTELDKEAMSRRLNCQRRQLDEGAKRDLIEKALLQYDSEGIHQTDEQIATECGAEQSWANEVRGELVRDGQITTPGYLTDDLQRERIEVAIDENPDKSDYSIGKTLGVSKNTVASVREDMEAVRVDIDGIDVRHADFRDVDLDPESVDHIVTNPPYTDDDLELWSDFAEFAERVLKPGGFAVAYCGKLRKNDHIRRLDEHLDYYWTLAIEFAGDGSKVQDRQLWDGYRPVLVYQKPPSETPDGWLNPDLIEGTGIQKKYHEWQQSLGEMTTIIEWLTDKGDLVLDPFAGSGTTLVACLGTDREAVGIEKEEEHVDSIHERLEEASDKE